MLKDNIKWKPCPFCGGTELDIKDRDSFEDNPATMYVSCEECKTDVWLFDTDNMSYPEALLRMAEKWNRRAQA